MQNFPLKGLKMLKNASSQFEQHFSSSELLNGLIEALVRLMDKPGGFAMLNVL